MIAQHINVGENFFFEMSERTRKSPGEIVMVIRRPGDRILLMTKDFYPENVYRLPTGKMKRGEIPEDCFAREVMEETGFTTSDFVSLGVVHYEIEFGDERLDYPSHVFATEVIAGDPSPIDLDEGITSFIEVTPTELLTTAAQLEQLPEPWSDWGRWRAIAHTAVREMLIAALPLQG